MMKLKVLTVLCFAILAVGVSDSKTDEQLKATKKIKEVREKKATQIATAWFNSLMKGNTAVATSLSSVPFAMDRKETIKEIAVLEDFFESLIEKKGKQVLQITKVSIVTDEAEIKKHHFSTENITVRILIGQDGVMLSVKPGQQYKIVGLSD